MISFYTKQKESQLSFYGSIAAFLAGFRACCATAAALLALLRVGPRFRAVFTDVLRMLRVQGREGYPPCLRPSPSWPHLTKCDQI